jgi:hypothetical protein
VISERILLDIQASRKRLSTQLILATITIVYPHKQTWLLLPHRHLKLKSSIILSSPETESSKLCTLKSLPAEMVSVPLTVSPAAYSFLSRLISIATKSLHLPQL